MVIRLIALRLDSNGPVDMILHVPVTVDRSFVGETCDTVGLPSLPGPGFWAWRDGGSYPSYDREGELTGDVTWCGEWRPANGSDFRVLRGVDAPAVPTDCDRARTLAAQLMTSVQANTLDDLTALLDKNQNPSTGDGSFDAETWSKLKVITVALRTASEVTS